jgi:hypothetical protein
MKYTLREYLSGAGRRVNRIDYKKLFYRVVVLAAVLLVVSGYLSYTRLYLTPERRFWMAMNNNLSTPSVVSATETGGTGNKSTEVTRFTFGGQEAQDKVTSVGFKNATSESKVVTETITTPETQYVRYLNIFSSEKRDNGSDYDFSKVIGNWAKDNVGTDAEALDNQRLTYAQPLITLAPFGNLAADARQAVMADLRNSGSYDVDYNGATYQTTEEGRKQMTLAVKVHTKKYVGVLQRYFRVAVFGEFPPLDPSGYSESARVNATFLIDMRSNTLAGISFNGQNESYGDFGVLEPVALPSKTISLDELQQRLQTAQ